MKKLALIYSIFAMILMSSCKQAQKGNIEVTNGEGKSVSIPYQIAIFKYDELISKVNKDDFKTISEKASSEAKMKCKFMPTYEPKEFSYMIENDTITVMVIFHAKNAMGVSDSQMSSSKFIGTTFISTL